jgi:hypothetical protein
MDAAHVSCELASSGPTRRSERSQARLAVQKPDTSPLRVMSDVYWHVFGREEIRGELRGNLVYVLEIPRTAGAPVLRHAFDPTGREFPVGNRQMKALLRRLPHGIIFQGLNRTAIYDVLLSDPRITCEDPQFILYNRQLIRNSQEFFLIHPDRCWDLLPEPTLAILGGPGATAEVAAGRKG